MKKNINIRMNKPKLRFGFTAMVFLMFSFMIASGIDNPQTTAPNNDYYFKINKSFEIFGNIFRELAQNYVIEIDPEDMMNEGIEGMLSNLDPYTVYMSESEVEDIDLLTTGSYVGVGVSVGSRNNEMTIVGLHDGYSARKQGLRIGDIIYKIDSTVVINLTTDELRKYTRGKPGTSISALIIRHGRKDTLQVRLQRNEIKVHNVSYSGIVFDSIGYIKLDRFSRESAEEVRGAFYDLKRKCNLKGIILDLRDNPGGLLEAAVSICEIFLPENSPIVTTRGRNKNEERQYTSIIKPIEPDLPLAVLINSNSASASEIVAGAIQDLDRGVIIGERSFGKGLVQSIFDLPFKATLKMTTAKYYTPSGRCIHKMTYDPQKHNKLEQTIHQDSVFYTKNHRPVVESKGIIPDSLVKADNFPDFIGEILKKNLTFNFATEWASNLDSLPKGFKVDDKILDLFSKYINDKNFVYKTKLEKEFDYLMDVAKKESASSKTLKEITTLAKKAKSEEKNPVQQYSGILKEILEFEIAGRFYSDEQLIGLSLKTDNYVKTANSLFKPAIYRDILTHVDSKEPKGN